LSISRRSFIKNASSGVAVAWAGLSITAGNAGAAELAKLLEPAEAQSAGAGYKPSRFIYGTQFYRPPSPPREMRRAMVKALVEEHKFNLIRIWPNWDYVNPEQDKWIFDEVEEVMRYADEFGMQVLCGLVVEMMPFWLEERYPESRFVDARGRIARLQGSSNNVTGGWPGLCMDWDPVREAAGKYIKELIKVVAPHKSLFGYDCWNEPHIEPSWPRNLTADPQEFLFCYCDRTLAAFRDWLREKYGTLDALNVAWTHRYPDWLAVEPPRVYSTYADWVDWRRFMMERETREMKFRVATARAVDAGHVMESHGARHPPIEACVPSSTNGWTLAECLDAWGLSLFPRWHLQEIPFCAAKFEITRSNAAGKPFYLTELQAGHGNKGLFRSPEMRPRDIRLYNWMAVAMGTKGLIYWNYAAEATGPEATGFGLVSRAGEPTEELREAAKMNQLIQAHWEIIQEHHPQTGLALLTDQDNAFLTFAAAGNEDASTLSFQGYYKAAWNMDLFVDFVEPPSLGKQDYKVIIAPWHLIGKKATLDYLRSFVEGGGTLIAEVGFGRYDERFYYNPVVPPFGLDELFGYRERESLGLNPQPKPKDVPGSDQVYYDPEIAFTLPVAARIKGHTYLAPLEVTSAETIATCRGMKVAVRKHVGKGWVYYIGTNLGASIAAGSDDGIELFRAIVGKTIQPAIAGGKLRPRLIEGKTRSLLAVFNDHVTDQSAALKLPASYTKATDLFTGTSQPVVAGAVKLTVPYQDAVVLLLE
jgi:beta-galactosidase GanA